MKKFDIKFSVTRPEGQREVTISADEIDSLSNSAWFREFIGLKDAIQVQALQQQVAELRAILADMRPVQTQIVAPQPRPAQIQTPVNTAPPQQPRLDSQVQAMLQPQPQLQRQSLQKPSYLDIDPKDMSEALWKSLNLTAEQQQQWMQHWGLVPR